MKEIQNFSKEELKEMALAVENDDIESFKNIIGYNSLPLSEKAIWAVYYQELHTTNDMPNNKHRISNVSSNDEQNILNWVKKIANKRLNDTK